MAEFVPTKRVAPMPRPHAYKIGALICVVVLSGVGSWGYLYQVLDPYWSAQRAGANPYAYHSDFYARWLGTRLALREKADPYSAGVTREIQQGIYGRPLDVESPEDPQAFAYPAHSVILIAPLTWVPFSTASRIFTVLSALAALGLMPLFLRVLAIKGTLQLNLIATAILFTWFPLAEAIYVQQFAILIIVFLAGGFVLLLRHRLAWAGTLFAIATIKPQLALVAIAWALLWSITKLRTRWPLLVSFLAASALFFLGGEWLVPGWFGKWRAAVHAFLGYRDLKVPAAWLLPMPLAYLVTAFIVAAAVFLLWTLRTAEPGQQKFGCAIALALSTTLTIIPTWPTLQYNHLLLIPGMLVIVHRWGRGMALWQGAVSLLAMGVAYGSSLGALLVSILILTVHMPIERLGHLAEAPFFNFAVVPLIFPLALTGILWKSVIAPDSGIGEEYSRG
jgi:Glycosyltransferase family 87